MSDSPFSDDDEGGVAEGWLTTFCDISMLLLCFFILLLSMSTLDKNKFSESFSSVRDSFGGQNKKNIASPDARERSEVMMDLAQQEMQMKAEQRKVFNDIQQFLVQNSAEGEVKATIDEGTITLQVPSEVLFGPGGEMLTAKGRSAIAELRDLFLKTREQEINIRGYTDNSPLPAGARYHDNWELSALRAVHVLRALVDGGIEPVRLTATGLGELNPLAPNDSPENRAKNRRVEFVLQRRVLKK